MRYEIVINADQKTSFEALHIAHRSNFQGLYSLMSLAQTALTALIVPIGFLALSFAVQGFITGAPRFYNPFVAPIVFLLGVGFSFWLVRAVNSRIAQVASNSSFARRQAVIIDEMGITQKTETSKWFTAWADIDAVHQGRNTLVLVIGATTMPLPNVAFNGESMEAFQQMQIWHREAHP